jgi:hypothetical protein
MNIVFLHAHCEMWHSIIEYTKRNKAPFEYMSIRIYRKDEYRVLCTYINKISTYNSTQAGTSLRNTFLCCHILQHSNAISGESCALFALGPSFAVCPSLTICNNTHASLRERKYAASKIWKPLSKAFNSIASIHFEESSFLNKADVGKYFCNIGLGMIGFCWLRCQISSPEVFLFIQKDQQVQAKLYLWRIRV